MSAPVNESPGGRVAILDEILGHKRRELKRARAAVPAGEMERRARERGEPTRGFREALRTAPAPRVIAEIKRRSPSRGEIRADFDPAACARAYASGGAAALSVLTDEHYFGGHLDFLAAARGQVELPILRKDFIVDPYQVDETRAGGADAVLLIVAALSPADLRSLRERAVAWGLDVLIEVHEESEIQVALEAGADLVGINNRDLRSFQVDLGVCERLLPKLPEGVLAVAESGIFSAGDVTRLESVGAHAFLVGEALMRERDIGLALRRLRRTS